MQAPLRHIIIKITKAGIATLETGMHIEFSVYVYVCMCMLNVTYLFFLHQWEEGAGLQVLQGMVGEGVEHQACLEGAEEGEGRQAFLEGVEEGEGLQVHLVAVVGEEAAPAAIE